MKTQTSNKTRLQDTSWRYELLLTIGKSFNPKENAQNFIAHLQTCEGIQNISLWLSSPHQRGSKANQLKIYTHTYPGSANTEDALSSASLKELFEEADRWLCFQYGEEPFRMLSEQEETEAAQLWLIKLRDWAFLKIWTDEQTPLFGQEEDQDVLQLFEHFASSLEQGFLYEKALEDQQQASELLEDMSDTVEPIPLLKHWLQHFNDAVMVTDEQGILLFLNKVAASRLRQPLNHLLDQPIYEVDEHNPWKDYLAILKKRGKLLVEGKITDGEGGFYPVEIDTQYLTYDEQAYIVIFARDITERKHTEELLLRKQNQLTSFVEAALAAIAIFDLELNYLAASQKWYEEYNLEEENLVGKNYFDVSSASSKHWRETLAQCLEGKIKKNEEEKIVLKDGTETWIKWEVRPWYNAENQVEGIIIFTEDITQQKRQEEELRIAKVKAEDGSRAKEQFLANMSHEIRTPMNAIQGMTRLLQRTNLTPRQATYQEAIKASSDNLLVIINDILDISKIEAGKMNIDSVGFDLNRLVRHLCNSIRHRAEEKGIGLFYEVDRRISKVLIGDPVRLNQILLNLVNNAIKFTDRGTVEIECRLKEAPFGHNVIEFQVIDTGMGIPEDKLSSIFESFTQGDDDTARKFGGTGLGLSISRRLVELFGGTLEVKSRQSTGTTFYFTLHLPIGKEADLARKKEAQKHDVNLEGLKILLAEDHDINQFLATTLLDEWGMVVEVVKNGIEAVLKLSKEKFQVVLMDIQMPIMGGIEATKIIRNQLKSNIPIIALTANALKGDAEKYLNAGMNGYVSKPFEPVELFNTIAQVVNPNGNKLNDPFHVSENNNKVTPKTNKTPSGKNDPNLLYDLSKLRDMVDNDANMVKKMVQMFLKSAPDSLKEMRSFHTQGELEKVSKVAHKLKSSINLMGISELHQNIRHIEQYSAGKDPKLHEKLPDLLKELEKVFDKVFSQMKKEVA